jgi:hypothetical protein
LNDLLCFFKKPTPFHGDPSDAWAEFTGFEQVEPKSASAAAAVAEPKSAESRY